MKDDPIITLTVGPHEGGTRLARFVADRLDRMGIRAAARLIASGAVEVNGHHRPKGGKLAVGDVVTVDPGAVEAASTEFVPRALAAPAVQILHRDPRTLVVHKPAGIHTAPLRPEDVDTLLSAALAIEPSIGNVKGFRIREAGLVHRLDRGTSGACLFALDQDAFDRLRTASESDLVVKDYTAVVHGKVLQGPSTLEATVPATGGRGKRVTVRSVRRLRSRGLAPRRDPSGDRILRMRMEILHRDRQVSLVRLKLTRGFRHQIRSVMEAIGHPVVGDELYGPAVIWPSMLLHCSRVVFPHPDDAHLVRVDSPPDRLRQAYRELTGKPGQ